MLGSIKWQFVCWTKWSSASCPCERKDIFPNETQQQRAAKHRFHWDVDMCTKNKKNNKLSLDFSFSPMVCMQTHRSFIWTWGCTHGVPFQRQTRQAAAQSQKLNLRQFIYVVSEKRTESDCHFFSCYIEFLKFESQQHTFRKRRILNPPLTLPSLKFSCAPAYCKDWCHQFHCMTGTVLASDSW